PRPPFGEPRRARGLSPRGAGDRGRKRGPRRAGPSRALARGTLRARASQSGLRGLDASRGASRSGLAETGLPRRRPVPAVVAGWGHAGVVLAFGAVVRRGFCCGLLGRQLVLARRALALDCRERARRTRGALRAEPRRGGRAGRG